ncbi:MAG: TetR/AcrR family transcriptional regulator [Pseudomonadota bacterium]
MTAKTVEKQKLAVLAAAAVFAEKGYHGASTTDIANRLGIKQGSLYHYFRSKEHALEAVCLFGIRDYVSRMEAIAVSEQPFEARLVAAITAHLSSYREKNEALKVHNDERLYLPVEKRSELKQLGSRYRQLLESMFQEGRERGALRPSVDPHFAAQAVIGLCNAWGELIVRDDEMDVLDVANRCVDLLLNGMTERRTAEREF